MSSQGAGQRAVTWCALAAMLACPHLAAAEWYVAANSSMDAGYTANPRFLQSGGDEEWNTAATLGVELNTGTERFSFSADPRLAFSRYAGDRDLDANDQHLSVDSSWRNELSSLSLGGQISHDSTQSSELGTTGLVQTNSRRLLKSVSAGADWNPTEKLSGGASAGWSSTGYAAARTSPLVDYTNRTGSVYGSFAASERTQVRVTATGDWLEVPGRAATTASSGVTLGVTHELGPLWSIAVTAGPSWAALGVATRRSYEFSTNISRRGENLQLGLAASHSLDPIGTGTLAETDLISLLAATRLAERLTLSVSAQASHNRQLFDEIALYDSETRYYAVVGSLNWQVSRDWSLYMSVQERSQEIVGRFYPAGAAESHRASVGITWRGRTYAL